MLKFQHLDVRDFPPSIPLSPIHFNLDGLATPAHLFPFGASFAYNIQAGHRLGVDPSPRSIVVAVKKPSKKLKKSKKLEATKPLTRVGTASDWSARQK